MSIIDLLNEEARNIGASEDMIKRAHNHASGIAGQGRDAKEKLNSDLTEEEIVFYKNYIRRAILCASVDSDKFKEITSESINEHIQRN